MKKLKILSIFLMLIIAFAGCKKDDFTGHSTQVPTNPTITVDLGTIPTVIDGVTQKHKITLNMDVAQIVDVAVHILVLDGTATEDEDFSLPNVVTISAGRTSASFEVTFLPDVIYEATETFKIQIGDERTANATMTPVTQDYTINNFGDTDIALEMSWTPEAFDQYGNQIDYTDIADMILYVYDPNDVLIATVDGGAYEGFVLSGDSIDGTYTIKAGFYSAMQFDVAVEMNLALDYEQPGVFTDAQDFTGLITTATGALCDLDIFLAEIEKAGATYTLTENAYLIFVLDINDFVGTYAGDDGSIGAGFDWQFPNPVTVALPGDLTIDGLNYDWMLNIWGETVTTSTPVVMTMSTDGTLAIADQYYMTTDYGGSPYDYDIRDVSGTWSSCDPASLHIEYDMYNTTDDYSLGQWLLDNGYSYTNYFIADITLGAKGVVKSQNYKKIKR